MNDLAAPTINRLIVAIVQIQDVEHAITALNSLNVAVNRLPSIGGFLGRKNVTLLIGLPDGLISQVIETLHEKCRQRVEYMASPLEGTTVPFSNLIPVNVGGATIFAIAVERYEEF
jgi:uncharacterized protein YaaQ